MAVCSYNNCNPGGPVGLPQGCKPIHWNPNTFLEKKVCWQIPGGGTPYVMGDTYVPRFWPPFFTLTGSSTIFLGYFFSSTNTKTIFCGIKTTNSYRIRSFRPQISFFPRSFWVQFSAASGTPPSFFGPSTPPGDKLHKSYKKHPWQTSPTFSGHFTLQAEPKIDWNNYISMVLWACFSNKVCIYQKTNNQNGGCYDHMTHEITLAGSHSLHWGRVQWKIPCLRAKRFS